MASSRVGASTRPRGARPRLRSPSARRASIGRPKARVLPDPVCARPRTFAPRSAAGMVAAWMGNGVAIPDCGDCGDQAGRQTEGGEVGGRGRGSCWGGSRSRGPGGRGPRGPSPRRPALGRGLRLRRAVGSRPSWSGRGACPPVAWAVPEPLVRSRTALLAPYRRPCRTWRACLLLISRPSLDGSTSRHASARTSLVVGRRTSRRPHLCGRTLGRDRGPRPGSESLPAAPAADPCVGRAASPARGVAAAARSAADGGGRSGVPSEPHAAWQRRAPSG